MGHCSNPKRSQAVPKADQQQSGEEKHPSIIFCGAEEIVAWRVALSQDEAQLQDKKTQSYGYHLPSHEQYPGLYRICTFSSNYRWVSPTYFHKAL